MKDVIIILAIILIIFGGDIWTRKYLNKTSEQLVQDLENLKQKAIATKENENRDELRKQLKKVEKRWQQTSDIWSIIAMHQEIDNIEQALTRAKTNIEQGELEDALPEIEVAIFFAEHINVREKVNLKNIF